MHDYAIKLWDGMTAARKIHRHALQYIMAKESKGPQVIAERNWHHFF